MNVEYEDSIPYIIHELSQKITADADQVLFERYGIGFSQYKVLLSVSSKQGIPQKEIAHNLKQTEASVSRQIGLLIDANLVEIGPAKDNRKHLIFLTPRGEEMVYKTSSSLANYQEILFNELSLKEVTNLKNTLKKLDKNTNLL